MPTRDDQLTEPGHILRVIKAPKRMAHIPLRTHRKLGILLVEYHLGGFSPWAGSRESLTSNIYNRPTGSSGDAHQQSVDDQ